MIADERLALIQIKINRAKEHLDNLKRALRVFLDSKPNVVQAGFYAQADLLRV